MLKPSVSIVMCTYNGVKYLPEQLDSILLQDYPLYEIIVQDDGSTDGTWEILEDYAQKEPLIKVFRNEGNHGINGNFFSALKRAKGDYIAISDQDDIWEKGKISKQVDSIGDNLMCGGFSKPFSSDGFPVKWDSRKPCLHLLRLSFLSEIPGHVQLFRRELLDYLPSEDAYPYLYDWQLQFMASAAEQLAFADEVLVNFRRHAGAATASVPVSNQGKEGLQTFFFLVKNYQTLHAYAAQRFAIVKDFIGHLQRRNTIFNSQSAGQALKMADLYISSGFISYIKLTFFCLKHHTKLYHAPTKWWKSILRAAYFPLYSLNYYRGIVK